MDENELREALAEYAHEAWSGWMNYMLPAIEGCTDLGLTELAKDPEWADTYAATLGRLQGWRRQANTPYADLSEAEKESDRKEADRMLALMSAAGEGPAAS